MHKTNFVFGRVCWKTRSVVCPNYCSSENAFRETQGGEEIEKKNVKIRAHQ